MSQQHIDNGLDQQTRNNSLATQHPEETKSIVAAASQVLPCDVVSCRWNRSLRKKKKNSLSSRLEVAEAHMGQ
jgi:lambda repressor-like predicted transcriptional regulator